MDILYIIDVKFSSLFSIESWGLIDISLPGCTVSSICINGILLAVCPDNCLSNFSFVKTLFAASTTSRKLLIGNKSQYSLLGKVFLNYSKIRGSPLFSNTATCLILLT